MKSANRERERERKTNALPDVDGYEDPAEQDEDEKGVELESGDGDAGVGSAACETYKETGADVAREQRSSNLES